MLFRLHVNVVQEEETRSDLEVCLSPVFPPLFNLLHDKKKIDHSTRLHNQNENSFSLWLASLRAPYVDSRRPEGTLTVEKIISINKRLKRERGIRVGGSVPFPGTLFTWEGREASTPRGRPAPSLLNTHVLVRGGVSGRDVQGQ